MPARRMRRLRRGHSSRAPLSASTLSARARNRASFPVKTCSAKKGIDRHHGRRSGESQECRYSGCMKAPFFLRAVLACAGVLAALPLTAQTLLLVVRENANAQPLPPPFAVREGISGSLFDAGFIVID